MEFLPNAPYVPDARRSQPALEVASPKAGRHLPVELMTEARRVGTRL